MRSSPDSQVASCSVLDAFTAYLCRAQTLFGQGGEPPLLRHPQAQSWPVRGRDICHLAVSRGSHPSVGKEVAINQEAWVIEGKGLTGLSHLIVLHRTLGYPPLAPQRQ